MVTGGGSCARLFRNETSHDIWPIALHSAELSRMLQMRLGLFLFEIQWKLEPTACLTLICTLDLFLGLLQCSAEVWSHPSCLLPRSQTLLQFLKQFWVIDLNALFFGLFVFWTFAAFSFFFKSALVLDHFQRNAPFKICFVKPLTTSISSLEKGANQGMKLLGWNEALCRWGDSERAISQKRVFFKNWGNWTSEVQKKKWQAKNYPQHRNGP